MKIKRLTLVLWTALTIFPMAVIGKYSARYLEIFNTIFGPVWVHVVMHAALFCGLVLLLGVGLRLRLGWRAAAVALLAILAVAAAQEGFQAISQGVFFLGGALEDLGVDLFGGAIGFGMLCVLFIMRRNRRLTAA